MDWESNFRFHEQAIAEFAAVAERVPAGEWRVPLAEGKWSPAEVVEHVGLAYAVLHGELEGGPGMKMRTKWWQRLVMRPTILRRILRGGGFPPNVPAPREIRPVAPETDPATAIAAFRERAARFTASVLRAHAGGRPPKLTHPYLGRGPLRHAVLLNARHTRHHLEQLAARFGGGSGGG